MVVCSGNEHIACSVNAKSQTMQLKQTIQISIKRGSRKEVSNFHGMAVFPYVGVPYYFVRHVHVSLEIHVHVQVNNMYLKRVHVHVKNPT